MELKRFLPQHKGEWLVNKIDNSTVEILFYGYINDEGIKASDFITQLKNLDENYSNINIRINSGGGNILDGFAIFNAIKACKANTTGIIDGVAASMASVIGIACNKLLMSSISMLMTHRAKGTVTGNADDLKTTANLLDNIEKIIAVEYAKKTGITPDEAKVKYLGIGDRWITANEALKEKLIDGICNAPTNITNEYLIPFLNAKNLLLSSITQNEIPDESISIEDILKAAVSDRDITEEQSALLKKQYQNNPKALQDLLKEFAKSRIDYLMSLSWNELDKSDMGAELHRKYLQGWQQKFFTNFGKMPAGSEAETEVNEKELDNLIRYAIANNNVKPEFAAAWKRDFKNDLPGLKKKIEEIAKRRVDELMSYSWGRLDKDGLLPELKRKYLQGFLQKYKSQFGVDYRENNIKNKQ